MPQYGFMRANLYRLVVILSTLSMCQVSFGEVSLVGTDLFSEEIIESIQRKLTADGHTIDLRFEGSLAAREALAIGTAEAVLVALPDPSERFDTSLMRYPVCSQVAALAVHETNPIFQMDLATLAGLYATGGTLLNWSQLSEDPFWKDRKISLYKAESGAALAAELFSAMALNHQDTKPTVRTVGANPEAIAAVVSDDPGAIVLVDLLTVGKPARYLAISPDSGSQGYSPTPDNIFFGDYPLRLPFELMVTPQFPPAILKSLLEVLYSEEVATAFTTGGFVPIPPAEREGFLSSFD
jgi:ABC-type phosphate transport system substrate-binding protein